MVGPGRVPQCSGCGENMALNIVALGKSLSKNCYYYTIYSLLGFIKACEKELSSKKPTGLKQHLRNKEPWLKG